MHGSAVESPEHDEAAEPLSQNAMNEATKPESDRRTDEPPCLRTGAREQWAVGGRSVVYVETRFGGA